jgi:molybdate transport system substrate-binding protein
VPAVTEEVDVKSVLTKVRLGEVDAGMVYRTDVRAAGSAVKGVGIPADVNVRTAYPVARVTGSEQPREAGAFIDLVLSDQGTAVLEEAGFGKP